MQFNKFDTKTILNSLIIDPEPLQIVKQIGYSECFRKFWGPRSYIYTQVSDRASYSSGGTIEFEIYINVFSVLM